VRQSALHLKGGTVMISAAQCFALLAVFFSVTLASVPVIERNEIQHVAKAEPWRVTTPESDRVDKHVQLCSDENQGTQWRRGWVDPAEHGGSMLDLVGNGFREPINVIISGASDQSLMSDQGLLDYSRSIGFSFECLHLHAGGLQHANLGDGQGYKPQLYEYRSIFSPRSPGAWIGACWESLAGGNHFRVWRQNGSLANTGAWFLAVSKEEDVTKSHTISTNGYDVGRDLLVHAATKGGTFLGHSWTATVDWKEGLLRPGKQGINHNISIDGRVAILTVHKSRL